jgi:hypothetical protein
LALTRWLRAQGGGFVVGSSADVVATSIERDAGARRQQQQQQQQQRQ